MNDTHGEKGKANRDKVWCTAKKETRLRGRPKAEAKGPTQAECVAFGLGLAAATGMFKKNGW